MTDEDLTDLASQLGYYWPNEPEDRQRVLRKMAELAAHWRQEVSKCQRETWPAIERERIMVHKNRMIRDQRRKITNLRRALRDFMKQQAAIVREETAALQQAAALQKMNKK